MNLGDYWLIPPGRRHSFHKSKNIQDFVSVKFLPLLLPNQKSAMIRLYWYEQVLKQIKYLLIIYLLSGEKQIKEAIIPAKKNWTKEMLMHKELPNQRSVKEDSAASPQPKVYAVPDSTQLENLPDDLKPERK